MQTEYISEFLDLVDTLNFTKSARRLGMSQSTLSRHIAALEGELRVTLFNRTAESVRLTREGRAFYEKARELVSSLQSMSTDLGQISEEKVHVIKVSGSTVQPTVNRFLSRMTARAVEDKLPIRFEYKQIRSISGEHAIPSAVDLLETGEVDMLLEILPDDSEFLNEFDSIKLCTEPICVFASDKNLLVNKTNLTLRDLSGNKLMCFAVYPHCPSVFESVLQNAGFTASHLRTVFVADLLEIPEALENLAPDEINVLQANFCAAYGFGDDGTGRVRMLDIHDERAVVTFYALCRKDEKREYVRRAMELARVVRDSYRDYPSPTNYQLRTPLFYDND